MSSFIDFKLDKIPPERQQEVPDTNKNPRHCMTGAKHKYT
jgi:hypothetical protein